MEIQTKPSVVLIFIDGLGLGRRDPETNPLARLDDLAPLDNFAGETKEIVFGGKLIATDASLGIEGRPQSASGQTTILTGINAPRLLGYHKQGFPNQILRDLIGEKSIFLQLKQKNIGPNVFVNTYTPQFFEQTPRWKSATTCAVEAAGMQFRRLPDLLGEKALFHDFTNRSLIEKNYDVPLLSPERAGRILARFSLRYRFALYEHFITDKIGHERDFVRAETHLPQLALFVRETIKNVDLEKTTVILTSDHGNIEDLSVRNHTLNKVPTIVWGRKRTEIEKRIKDLADITPAVLWLLSE